MSYSPFRTLPDAAQEAGVWVRELAEHLGCEQRVAYDVLRVTLHAVRDSLSPDENAKVGNRLPVVLRGIYFEGWNPSKVPCQNEPDALLKLIASRLPSAVAANEQLFGKILKLLESRLGDKLPTKLDAALRACAKDNESTSAFVAFP